MSTRKVSLSKTWQRVRTVPGLGKDVAALAVLVVVAIGATLGIQSFLPTVAPWDDRFEFKVEFAEVPGLNPGASTHIVTIAGVRVGDVESFEPTDRGTAVVSLSIEPGIATIHDNATAVLRPRNPLNDMMITIDPGGPPGRPLEEDGVIPVGQTKRPIQVNEALGHLDERTRTAITDLMLASDIALAKAPEQLPGGLAATESTLIEARPVMEALESRRENIRELVTALSQISAAIGEDHERTTQLAQATQETLGVLAENDDALQASLEQMPGFGAQLRNAFSATQELTTQLDPTLDNLSAASEALPDALDRFEDTVAEVGETVDVAEPFIAKARPVVADLRPLVTDVDEALDDTIPVTTNLDRDTNVLTTYLTVIQAFFYNTSSVFGVGDAQGGNIRGHVMVGLPDGAGTLPDGQPGYTPGPENGLNPGEPSEFTPIPDYVPGADEHNARNGTGGN